ncbi:hypothetical protein CPC735_068410 [Coccidioides posadasii C735 delta SOWgp]|uniref:BZIP domain-containing protein n=1 Tax=Coccidioides posadasii (strain C735) TaxID=222929 RepID=C5P0F1_COCP7|nr:hypothetical protein CPC735_068410 [Coccidioides posadasii C735 delta SOWgp]EER29159.1 hypothetical protein CPC735_068410 [Coccidioides posadasii C735 delta SOWgp]|eukprot:XP_003071304.1 hypothetical protein CPC735_068410 [Coccidioides posadasii C735 delta SOWgp]
MAATKRRRQATELEVPDHSEDAAERKRVLNVLAQRRYRKRKRERLAALEKELEKSKGRCSPTDPPAPKRGENESSSNSPVAFSQSSASSTTTDDVEGIFPLTPPQSHTLSRDTFTSVLPNAALSDVTGSSLLSQPDFLDSTFESLLDLEPQAMPPGLDSFPPELLDSPALAWQFLSNPANLEDGRNPDLSSSLQSHQTSTFTFPDDRTIDVPTLTLLKAVLTIATRLDITQSLWDISGISPFFTGPGNDDSSSSLAHLPVNFRPTPTQRLIPHHPMLDLLPWPTVRDKLIQVFSLPPHLRPAPAADPMGLVTLVYDIEDPTEGIRVSGSDPFLADKWEIGQIVFQRWWWAFEGSIVETSNRLRKQRGQQGLVLGTVG